MRIIGGRWSCVVHRNCGRLWGIVVGSWELWEIGEFCGIYVRIVEGMWELWEMFGN